MVKYNEDSIKDNGKKFLKLSKYIVTVFKGYLWGKGRMANRIAASMRN